MSNWGDATALLVKGETMLQTTEAIHQSQLLKVDASHVVAHFAESSDVISVQPGGEIQHRPAGSSGDYERATITANGHLCYRPTLTRAFILPGVDLVLP